MDGGLRQCLASDVLERQLSKPTGQFLKSHPDMYTPSHQSFIATGYMRGYSASQWLSFKDFSDLNIGFDGVRAGNPGTDITATFAYDPKKKRSTWLPTMEQRGELFDNTFSLA